ncbi:MULTISPECIES: LamB/YcsF family protein [Bacillaceae]|uniref:5-oxoprolinase subunit A n=1 Tax=Evansella alkalicola TaxID=745819 RepID=A0ABS6JPC0_9BACI|nr:MULTISPECIES: 5-oxoprolinase subunit PxpA [Bacillaceae]MBU9719941.1 LamB/YcsF family protein [Bacillus alkalicola]
MNLTVDVNSDIGESFGVYKIGQDEEVIKHITSANIACGYHAGDHNVMHQTVALAAKYGVGIGAHPGLQDLPGFGRRKMEVTPEEVYNMTVYQVSAIQGFANIYGHRLQHVKPHGALYNMAAKDRSVADAICQAVKDISKDGSLLLFALAGSELVKSAHYAGIKVVEEVFADRTYQPDGTLTPRSQPDAVIHDPHVAVTQAIQMVREGLVTAVDGSRIPIVADSICVHGDSDHALQFVQMLRRALSEHRINVKNPTGV